MQTSLWFLSFFYFCIIFLLIPFFMRAHRNQIPVCTSLSELIWSIFFYLYWQWVNSTVGWIPGCLGWNCLLNTAGREQASVMPLVYLKVRIVFVLTILTTYLPPRPAAQRGTYEEEVNDSGWDISVCLLFSYVCVCVFNLWRNEKFFRVWYRQQYIWC